MQDLKVVFNQPDTLRGELRVFSSDLLSPASPQQYWEMRFLACFFSLGCVACAVWVEVSSGNSPCYCRVFFRQTSKSELGDRWWQSLQAGQGPTYWRQILFSVFTCCGVVGEASLKWNWMEVCCKELDEALYFFHALWQVVNFGSALLSLDRVCFPRRVSHSHRMVPLSQCSWVCARLCAQRPAGLGFASERQVRNWHG